MIEHPTSVELHEAARVLRAISHHRGCSSDNRWRSSELENLAKTVEEQESKRANIIRGLANDLHDAMTDAWSQHSVADYLYSQGWRRS